MKYYFFTPFFLLLWLYFIQKLFMPISIGRKINYLMKENYSNYLKDILNAIINLDEFTVGLFLKNFSKDKKTIAAVMRNLKVIGEATKNVPSFIRQQYPSIPWK